MKKNAIDILILVIVSFGIFFRSLSIDFVGDDLLHIDYSWESFKDIFFHYFRPLTNLSLLLDKKIWGGNYSGFHLTNLILHTFSTVLVYLLGLKIVRHRIFGIMASLLFLLHPSHSISIFWISGRVDILCTLFYLLSFLIFISYQSTKNLKYLYQSTAFYVLALLSKEMAISLPILLTVYVLVFPSGASKSSLKKALFETWPFWVVAILFVIFRITFVGFEAITIGGHTNINPIHLVKNFVTFIGLLIVPGWHITISNFLKANPSIFLTLSIISLAALAALFRLVIKEKGLLFFSLMILITVLPVLRLAMRWYLYLPSVGFSLALAYLIWTLYQKGYFRKPAFLITTSIIASVYAYFINVEQNRWLESSRMSKTISHLIADKIVADRVEHCLILSVPGEFEETPVLMHGLNSLVNFRLKEDFDFKHKVSVDAASLVSIRNSYANSFPRVVTNDSNIFELTLHNTDSYFAFPGQMEVISGTKSFTRGYKITNPLYDIQVTEINSFGQVNGIKLKILDFSIPLYLLTPGGLESLNNVIDSTIIKP